MKKNSISILIADDHELFRKGIISLLIGESSIRIIGEANNGKDLIYKFLKLKPDMILTDISMPELSGLEAVKTLTEQDKNIKVIFLSMFRGDDYIYHCLKAGGSGLLNKDISKKELISSINKVNKGEKCFAPIQAEYDLNTFIDNYEKRLISDSNALEIQLTNKETEILLLIAEGMTSSEIADKLFIAKRTVDTHRINLMEKLKLKSFPQMMKYAIDFAASLKQRDSLD